MCQERKYYKIVHCCEWCGEYLRLNEYSIKHKDFFSLDIKKGQLFIKCKECQEERREALSEDYSKDE